MDYKICPSHDSVGLADNSLIWRKIISIIFLCSFAPVRFFASVCSFASVRFFASVYSFASVRSIMSVRSFASVRSLATVRFFASVYFRVTLSLFAFRGRRSHCFLSSLVVFVPKRDLEAVTATRRLIVRSWCYFTFP